MKTLPTLSVNPYFPALRAGATAVSGAARQKKIPIKYNNHENSRHLPFHRLGSPAVFFIRRDVLIFHHGVPGLVGGGAQL